MDEKAVSRIASPLSSHDSIAMTILTTFFPLHFTSNLRTRCTSYNRRFANFTTFPEMVSKHDSSRGRYLRDALILSVTVAMIIVAGIHSLSLVHPLNLQPPAVHDSLASAAPAAAPPQKRLLFYNRPPKTGSTSVRIAMKQALDAVNYVSAKCFNMIEWNEMGLRTIVNRRDIDFYGCHTRLHRDRYLDVISLRNGNVTFMTSTRPAKDIILSAYLQEFRSRNIASITDPELMTKEVETFKQHLEKYPVDALYGYHGADVPLKSCPYEWHHVVAMRKIAERYEIVVDLERPRESAAMVQVVTGLNPDFTLKYNERTKDMSPMLEMLHNVDTSHKSCGNELVHDVLSQQFNIIKDRLMQNRCFDEGTGTYEICDMASLTADSIGERTRKESFQARAKLMRS